ncbi:MAG: hypothetical protein LBF56_01110 [Holosporales bacterium]|nr:hypothetical protein [Holosporales bacterium]
MKFLKWCFRLGISGILLNPVLEAADIPVAGTLERTKYEEYIRLDNEALATESKSELFAMKRVNGQVPTYAPKVYQAIADTASNSVGRQILATLLAYKNTGKLTNKITICKGNIINVTDQFSEKSSKVIQAGARKVQTGEHNKYEMYVFPGDNNNMFTQESDRCAYISNMTKKCTAQKPPENDEQLAHELIHIIRMVNNQDLKEVKEAPLTQKFYRMKLGQQKMNISSTEINDCIRTIGVAWEYDEETEVITGQNLTQPLKRYAMNQRSYHTAKSAANTNFQILHLTLINPDQDESKSRPDIGTDLKSYYDDYEIVDAFNEPMTSIHLAILGLTN